MSNRISKPVVYTVRGHWPFPLYMWGHDCACATCDRERRAIERLSLEHAPDRAAFQDVEIYLTGPHKPNTARWESFGWKVPSDLEFDNYRRIDRKSVV